MLTLSLIVGIMLALIVIGMPISLAMLLSGTVVFWIKEIPSETIVLRLFNGILKYELIAIPMFIMIGNILAESGLSTRLIAFANSLVGFMRGGMAMVNVVTNMIMAEMSGTGTADAAILSRIFIPEMERIGYDRGFSAAVNSASASLGIIIPPSLPMIILGLYTDTSIVKLFLAGIVPGLLLAMFQIITCYILARSRNYPLGDTFSFKEVWHRFLNAWFVLLIPVCILGPIFSGVATVTEGAEVGLVISLLCGFIYGKLGPRGILRILRLGVRQSAVIMLIVAVSTLISWIFANERVAYKVLDIINTLDVPRWFFLLMMIVFLIILGTFMQSTATIVIVAPLLLPVAKSMGLDPLQYGMIIVLGQALGQQTPPVATVLLTVASVSRVPIEEILPSLGIFLISFVVVMILVTYIPCVSLFVPGLVAR
jgi:C4-dicarboxylate transporter DctM subunit